jgi:hypothetical protein
MDGPQCIDNGNARSIVSMEGDMGAHGRAKHASTCHRPSSVCIMEKFASTWGETQSRRMCDSICDDAFSLFVQSEMTVSE